MKKIIQLAIALSLALWISACTENTITEQPDSEITTEQSNTTAVEEDNTHHPQVTQPTYRILKQQELANKIGSAPQTFTINTSQDNTITGKHGTRLFIPKGCFVNPPENLEIKLTEAYDFVDILAYDLTTSTDKGELLSSKGMIKLETNTTTEVQFAKGKSILVTFPGKENDPSSDLFYGKRNADGTIKWVATNQETTPALTAVSESPVASEVETNAVVKDMFVPTNLYEPLVCYACEDTVNKYLLYPEAAKKQNKVMKVFMDVTINQFGEIERIEPLTKYDPGFGLMESTVAAVKKLTTWAPVFMSKKPITSQVRLKFVFTGQDMGYKVLLPEQLQNRAQDKPVYDNFIAYRESREKFDKNMMLASNEVIKEAPIEKVEGYVYSMNSWGWSNCDYFMRIPERKKATLVINGNYQEEKVRFIIFGKEKAMTAASNVNGKPVFQSVPKKGKIALIGVKMQDDELLVAIDKIDGFDPDKALSLNYETYTYAQLREELKHLNN